MFALDQVGGASRHQAAEIAVGSPTSPSATVTPAGHAQPRRFIDGAARTLTTPFRSLIQSGSQWSKQIFVTLCALLVYGFGLGYLMRYSQGIP